mmetsp:Transcript_60212/g.67312  ORF Transcript_60212/g.67312 Transcript_60212/m.67312 type:complete len:99 (-) Transcript_60212:115-411(-)
MSPPTVPPSTKNQMKNPSNFPTPHPTVRYHPYYHPPYELKLLRRLQYQYRRLVRHLLTSALMKVGKGGKKSDKGGVKEEDPAMVARLVQVVGSVRSTY